MRSRLILPALLFQLASVSPSAGAQAVVATVTMHDPRALDVTYRIAPSCKALTFENPGMKAQVAALVRSDWAPADDCAEIDFQSIRPRHAACTTLRLRVPATTRARDRRLYDGAHPWAQPFGDGLYAHSAAYAVQDSCGPVEWRFEAPGGTVMAGGVAAAQAATRTGAPAGGLPVLLLAAPFAPDAPPFHAEARVDPAAQTLLATTVRQSLRALHAMLPALPLRPGYVLAASGDASTLRSETPSPDVIRLLVPATPPADFRARARALVAHESAHLAQPADGRDTWREAWQDDLPAIREGGAEFLRLAASVRLGWLTRAQLKDELEAALNSCLMTLEDRPWRAYDQRNGADNAWRCGLTLHLLALARPDGQAGAQAGAPTGARANALQRLQDYYGRARAGAPTDFAQALECGAAAGCTPRRLARVRGAQPLASIVRDEARAPDSLLHAAPAWGPALVETMAFRHLEQLMRADCRGGANIAHDKAAPRIGPGLRCGVLRSGMVVTTAEGLPLFAGGRAVQASARACRHGGSTTLGLQDGRSVRVACGRGVALPEDVFGVDADKAMAMMGGSGEHALQEAGHGAATRVGRAQVRTMAHVVDDAQGGVR